MLRFFYCSEKVSFLVFSFLYHFQELLVLDLLGDNVMEELHGVFSLDNSSQVGVLHLLVIAMPLGQFGQVHDEQLCGLWRKMEQY